MIFKSRLEHLDAHVVDREGLGTLQGQSPHQRNSLDFQALPQDFDRGAWVQA
jgi:hypothetical protein